MMSDVTTLRHHGKAAYQAHNFLNASQYFSELLQKHPGDCTDWDYHYAINSLRKVGRSQEALALGQAALDQYPDNDVVRNAHGWTLYSQIAQYDVLDEATRLDAALQITRITKQSQYSPYTPAVFAVVKILNPKGKTHRNYARILEWLDKLDPAHLDATPKSIRSDKLDELASDLEQWYQLRSNCLLEMRRYDECIIVCSEALDNLASFHYDNDLWFRRRRAEAHLSKGEPDATLVDFEFVLKRKRGEYWAYHDLARVYAVKQDWAKARDYCIQAALAGGPLQYKWEVYYHLSRICLRFGDTDRAVQHLQLTRKVRDEQGWSMPPETQKLATELNVQWEDARSATQMERQLRSYWETLRPTTATTHQGTVYLIHANGKSGLIKTGDGQVLFFGMYNVDRKLKGLVAGTPVRFNLKEAVNQRTGQAETHAVDIIAL